MTQAQFWSGAQERMIRAAETWQLHPEVAWLYGIAAQYMEAIGQNPPRIISGYRDPVKQADLYRRYLRGDPGVRYAPARQSWHLPDPQTGTSRAIDLDPSDPGALATFDWLWSELGGRSGKTFGDDNHFDLPGPARPAPAY